MGYCTTSDIQDRYKKLTLASSDGLTSAKVQSLIDTTSVVIDGRIGKKYSTPVVEETSPNAFAILKDITIKLVVAEVDDILGQATRKENTYGKTRAERYLEDAERKLRMIQSGEEDLDDATRIGTSTFANGNDSQTTETVFKKDTTQW